MSITKNHERLQNEKVFKGNEAYLGYVISKPQNHQDGTGVLEIGLDVGSTSSRWMNFDSETGDESDFRTLDSDSGMVGDISHIKSDTNKFYDNLELEIKDVTLPSAKASKMFEDMHIVKCGLNTAVRGTNLKRASRESKVNLVSTYVNIITSMAVNVVLDMHENNVALGCYKFIPSIALPPEDFKSDIIQQKFKNNLAGKYLIKFNRLGIEFEIIIKAEDIYLEKESDSVLFNIMQSRDEELDGNTFILDGGGKSSDKSVIRDGVLVKDASDTSKYGGARLLKMISDEYVRSTGKSAPSEQAVLKSLEHGKLVIGNVSKDITEIIGKAKFELARALYDDFLETLDVAEMSVDELSNLVLHGRLFTPTTVLDDGGNIVRTISIADYFISMVKQINPDIKTFVELGTGNICRGALISRLVYESDDSEEE